MVGDFPPVESAHCVVHRLEGIVHCRGTTDSLLCGRRMSLNMNPLIFHGKNVQLTNSVSSATRHFIAELARPGARKNSAGDLPAVKFL